MFGHFDPPGLLPLEYFLWGQHKGHGLLAKICKRAVLQHTLQIIDHVRGSDEII
jgi:hypothetical protein